MGLRRFLRPQGHHKKGSVTCWPNTIIPEKLNFLVVCLRGQRWFELIESWSLLDKLVQTVLLLWVTFNCTLLVRTWCVIEFFILLTAFVAQSPCQLCLKVKVYMHICVCTICHILISFVLQQHHISSVFEEFDWLQTWATSCNWNSFTCFIAAVFELHSTAWGKPWNLLCSNKTPLGYDCAGVQGPNQQICKKVLPPPAQVNDSFNFYQLKINCIFQ